MMKRINGRISQLIVLASLSLVACRASAQVTSEKLGAGDSVALASLIALGDGHLQQIATHFEMLASTSEARSADWQLIRVPLGASEWLKQQGLVWFALPDGSYWSVQGGRASGNLSDRPYWGRLMAGQKVIGDLVVSRASGKASAIVAVPVRGSSGSVVGVLGSSVSADSLSDKIRRAMNLRPNQIFFAVDSTPIGALNVNPALIFTHPFELHEPELERAIREMLTRQEGFVAYSFRGKRRTMLYRKSQVSGWWYAFGRVWN